MNAEHKDYGLYTVRPNQNPKDIALVVYSDANRVPWLLEANPDSDWVPGEQVVVPNRKGYVIDFEEDDGPASLLSRCLPGKSQQQYTPNLLKWNANLDYATPGGAIFVPDPQTWGY